MNEDNVRLLADQVEESLRRQPGRGFRQLNDLARRFASGTDLLHRSLLLRLDYNEITQEMDYARIVRDLRALDTETARKRLLAGDTLLRKEDIQELVQLAGAGSPADELEERLRELDRSDRSRRLQAIIDSSVELTHAIAQQSGTAQTGGIQEGAAPIQMPDVEPKLVFECRGLSKSYRSTRFELPPFDLRLRLGEITGLVGENATGKTTILRLVAGDLAADAGVLGYPLFQQGPEPEWKQIKQFISFVPQSLPAWQGPLIDTLHYEAALHGLRGRQNEEEVAFIIHRLGLADYVDKSWGELSGGYRLRFALARALVWKPKLLLLDEPLAFLDVNTQLTVLQDLRRLAQGWRHPVSILISSQHLHEIESVADQMLILKENEVAFYGPVNALGRDRRFNVFELQCDLPLDELEARLQQLPLASLQDTGLYYALFTSLEVDAGTVLQALLQANVRLRYFRDISESTKRFFL